MEDTEILNLWKSYDKKLEHSLMINRQNVEDITKMKIRSLLASMTPLKIFTVLTGIAWVAFVDILVVNLFHVASPFFLISAGFQSLLTTLAIGIYLYQLIVIQRWDVDEPILATQQNIVRLKLSTLWIDRILFLQLPAWTTFYWNKNMLTNGSAIFIQLIISGIFTFAAIWLFFNIKYDNRDKKWLRFIFSGQEWNSLIKAMQLLKENEESNFESE